MIQFVDFVPKVVLSNSVVPKHWAVISIANTQRPDVQFCAEPALVLHLKFDDIHQDTILSGGRGTPFCFQDAVDTLQFLNRLHASNEPLGVLVQCDSGRARSSAIALFIAGAFGARFTHTRRVDGRSECVLSTLEAASGFHVSREITPDTAPTQLQNLNFV